MENLNIFQASMKIIKSEIKSSGDILAYLEEEKILKNTILDVFHDATGEVQCRIACLHLNQSIKWAGEIVMEGLAKKNCHDLQEFFSGLCKQLFPACKSSIIESHTTLCQGNLSIADYGKALRILNEGMGTDVDHYIERIGFVRGLNKGKVRTALLTHAISELSFEALINLACQVEINLSDEKEEFEEKMEETGKVKGVKLSREYFRIAKVKGLSIGKCYNCFSRSHSCSACPRTHCQFCQKKVNKVGHFSLLCPLCPQKL